MRTGPVILALLLTFAALSGPASATTDPRTLVVARAADVVSMDPAATTRMNDFLPISLAYERLVAPVVAQGRPTGELRGALARQWRSTDNGRTWTFEIQTGHRFNDGSTVDAAAVKTSFDRLRAVGRGPAQILDMLQGVEARGAGTVVFHLNRPFPLFAQMLTLPMFSIVNPTVVEHAVGGDAGSAWLSRTSAGSGPYQVVEWRRGQWVRLAANTASSAKRTYFEGVRIEVIKDDLSRVAQLRRGGVDIMTGVAAELAPHLAASPHVRVLAGPSATLTYLEMNNRRRPLDDARVRRAISLSADRTGIVRGLLLGRARLVGGVLPPGMVRADPGQPAPARDLRQARALLAAARRAGRGPLKLSYMPGDPVLDAVAVTLQANLADTGLRIVLEPLSPSAFNEKVRFAGDFDLALRSYGADFPDPWIVMDPVYASASAGPAGNVSRYANAQVDALLRQAALANGPSRLALYMQAQRLIVADMPHAILYSPDSLLAQRDDIVGPTPNYWQPDVLDVAHMTRRRP